MRIESYCPFVKQNESIVPTLNENVPMNGFAAAKSESKDTNLLLFSIHFAEVFGLQICTNK